MIRRPSTHAQLYAWHTAALAGDRPETHPDLPQCGWFRRRLVKGGPWVPAEIRIVQVVKDGELNQPEEFCCIVNRELRNAAEEWVWLASNPISEQRYREMSEAIEYAGSYDPTNPILAPDQAIDLSARPTPPGGI